MDKTLIIKLYAILKRFEQLKEQITEMMSANTLANVDKKIEDLTKSKETIAKVLAKHVSGNDELRSDVERLNGILDDAGEALQSIEQLNRRINEFENYIETQTEPIAELQSSFCRHHEDCEKRHKWINRVLIMFGAIATLVLMKNPDLLEKLWSLALKVFGL